MQKKAHQSFQRVSFAVLQNLFLPIILFSFIIFFLPILFWLDIESILIL